MSVRTISSRGPSSNRVDIVFLGDGYTAGQLAADYTGDAQKLVDYLFSGNLLTQPFGRYKEFFNIHLIDVVSAESGADNPGDGTVRNTALDSSYFFDGATERLLYVNGAKADAAVAAGLNGTGIDAEMRFVVVNDAKYGGGGGKYAVYAGDNASSLEVAVHEVGHSFAGLADEYGGNTTWGRYNGAEPVEVNVTTDATGAKWSRWIGYDQPGIGLIGSFEGGRYFDLGVYRPSDDSKMRSLGQPFDAISREAFVLKFYELVDPLDSWIGQGQTGPLVDIPTLWVQPISGEIIDVNWSVNGTRVALDTPTLSLAQLGLGPGTYTITAVAADNTDWVRADRSSLEQTVSWTVQLTKPLVANLAELFAANADTASGLSAAYDVLLGGVPNRAGFEALINAALATNFGAGAGPVFNAENIFINLANNLVQGNAAALATFNTLAVGTTLAEKITSLYQAIIPPSAQTAEGLGFLTRPEGLTFYQQVAAERGVAGTDGAAIVAMASLLKIAVSQDIGVGNAVNDLIKAVADGSHMLPASGEVFTDIEVADGIQFDGDDAAANARSGNVSAPPMDMFVELAPLTVAGIAHVWGHEYM